MATLFDPTTKDTLASPNPRIAASAAQTGFDQMAAQISSWCLVEHNADGTHNMSAKGITSGILPLVRGGTASDLSNTGGASQVLMQASQGGPVSVRQLQIEDMSDVGTLTSWTPQLLGSTSGEATYTSRSGYYVVLGYLVVADFSIQIATKGSMVGNVTIGNLPAATAHANGGGLSISYWYGMTTAFLYMSGLFTSTSAVTLYGVTSGSTGMSAIQVSDIGSTLDIRGQLRYLR